MPKSTTTGPDHYSIAEEALEDAAQCSPGTPNATHLLTLALTHATLALTAAIAATTTGGYAEDWAEVIS